MSLPSVENYTVDATRTESHARKYKEATTPLLLGWTGSVDEQEGEKEERRKERKKEV